MWVLKLVSHFSGAHRQLSQIDPTVENVCPCCGCNNESSVHITRCKNEGRTTLFLESVEILVEFLADTGMDTALIQYLMKYLHA